MYGPPPPPYGHPQPPYGAPAPSGYGTAQRPRNVTTAAVLALVYAALRIIACLFLLVATIRLSLHDTTRAVPNFVDLFVGGVFACLMTLGAVAALKGRTTKILFFTSLALLIVSIILVPTTVAPERVSPAELVRAGSAVLSLIVSVIIIVLLSTAQEPHPVRSLSISASTSVCSTPLAACQLSARFSLGLSGDSGFRRSGPGRVSAAPGTS